MRFREGRRNRYLIGRVILNALERIKGREYYNETAIAGELSAIDPGNRSREAVRAYFIKKYNRGGLIFCAGLAASVILFTGTVIQGNKVTEIKRNGYGESSREVKLIVEGEEEEDTVSLTISPREYSKEAAETLFVRGIKELDSRILKEGDTFDCVRHNLNLVTEVIEGKISVRWKPDSYRYVNSRGELEADSIPSEGIEYILKAELTIGEYKKSYERTVTIFPPERKVSFEERVAEKVSELNGQDVTGDRVVLPKDLNGERIYFRKPADLTWGVLLALGFFAAVLIIIREDENVHKAMKERNRQLVRAYPEMLNKTVLLLGAGMSMRRVWEKLAADFAGDKGKEYLNREIRILLNELGSGVAETDAYEHFGNRCALPEYMRFSVMLTQNSRKGSKDLIRLFRTETQEAFSRRKGNARKLGEEAGTKLLLPMIMMLGVVLLIIMVPAFMTMQI